MPAAVRRISSIGGCASTRSALGLIETPIFDKLGVPAEAITEALPAMLALMPMGRVGRPEEAASVALFLASDDSSFVTGVDLPVDGGMGQV